MSNDLIVQPRTKPMAGCWECHGATMRWVGKNADEHAQSHAKDTGHAIWVGEIDLPPRKEPPPPKRGCRFRDDMIPTRATGEGFLEYDQLRWIADSCMKKKPPHKEAV